MARYVVAAVPVFDATGVVPSHAETPWTTWSSRMKKGTIGGRSWCSSRDRRAANCRLCATLDQDIGHFPDRRIDTASQIKHVVEHPGRISTSSNWYGVRNVCFWGWRWLD